MHIFFTSTVGAYLGFNSSILFYFYIFIVLQLFSSPLTFYSMLYVLFCHRNFSAHFNCSTYEWVILRYCYDLLDKNRNWNRDGQFPPREGNSTASLPCKNYIIIAAITVKLWGTVAQIPSLVNNVWHHFEVKPYSLPQEVEQ